MFYHQHIMSIIDKEKLDNKENEVATLLGIPLEELQEKRDSNGMIHKDSSLNFILSRLSTKIVISKFETLKEEIYKDNVTKEQLEEVEKLTREYVPEELNENAVDVFGKRIEEIKKGNKFNSLTEAEQKK